MPSSLTLPTSWSGDRAANYYPYAISQGSAATLGFLSAHHTQNSVVYNWFSKQNIVRQPKLIASLPGSSSDFTAVYSSPPTAAERTAFVDSFFARSVSLVFVKSMVDTWASVPPGKNINLNEFKRIDFKSTGKFAVADSAWRVPGNQAALGVLQASPWSVNASGVASLRAGGDLYGIPMTTGRLNASTLALQSMWEGVAPPQYDTAAIPAPEDSIPREYVYCVVPSPLGVGRLVRAHLVLAPAGRNAAVAVNTIGGIGVGDVLSTGTYPLVSAPLSVGMVVDSVLSENVVRVVFETIRTQPLTTSNRLAINQVRMRLYLVKLLEAAGDEGTVIKSNIDTVITMRTNNTPPQIITDTALVPALPNGFQF